MLLTFTLCALDSKYEVNQLSSLKNVTALVCAKGQGYSLRNTALTTFSLSTLCFMVFGDMLQLLFFNFLLLNISAYEKCHLLLIWTAVRKTEHGADVPEQALSIMSVSPRAAVALHQREKCVNNPTVEKLEIIKLKSLSQFIVK